MAYATQTDIERAAGGLERLKEIADWDADGTVDAAVITTAQAWADSQCDLYSRLRFAELKDSAGAVLPFAAWVAAHEAVYWLRLSRGQVSETDTAQHDERVQFLRDVGEGKGVPASPLPAKSTSVGSQWRDRDPDGTSTVWTTSYEKLKGLW